jgi:putative ABC transport system substrate-binding protein
MKRREFITLLGGALATPLVQPLAARAQRPAMPAIGFLNSASLDTFAHLLRAFRQGLKETGFVEGENVAIESRWAESQFGRLPALAGELVRRKVAALVATGGTQSASAAKAATKTIPIVFAVGEDPVRLGLVASLSRPGGNVTGINYFIWELLDKRLALLRELLPAAKRVAVLANPANAARAESALRDMKVAARAIGMEIQVVNASTSAEIDAAFAAIARDHVEALFVLPDPFFVVRRVQLANLAARHAIPTAFPVRDFAEAGGLMSYGSSIADAYRQVGVYTGRILKGAKPADLPVVQSAKFELVINAQTARMLGLAVPPSLLATADEVIE